MKYLLLTLALYASLRSGAQDLVWNTSAIPNNSTSFNFGPIGSPSSSVTYAVTGSGTITAGPARFTTAQGNISWRTAITFGAVSDLKVYTFTFSPAVCNLSFLLYDIDGDNASGDRAIINANYLGTPQTITMTALDGAFAGGPPTITGSGTTTVTGLGTQGNQTDDRVQVTVNGCVSTLVIQYGNNPAGIAGGRSFSIGDMSWSGSTLPVTFTAFSAEKMPTGNIEVKWCTANEINAGKFEIERSVDGQAFTPIGMVNALNTPGAYSFIDPMPLQGTSFYRIKQTDVDGRYQYSTTIAVKPNPNTSKGITVFPNPATNFIFITTNNGRLIDKVEFIDASGKVVLIKKGSENRLDVSSLPQGLYRVKVTQTNAETFTGTFMKQ